MILFILDQSNCRDQKEILTIMNESNRQYFKFIFMDQHWCLKFMIAMSDIIYFETVKQSRSKKKKLTVSKDIINESKRKFSKFIFMAQHWCLQFTISMSSGFYLFWKCQIVEIEKKINDVAFYRNHWEWKYGLIFPVI